MTDIHDLLVEAVNRKRARPWLVVTPDGQAHFYVRTSPHAPDHVDVAAELARLQAVDAELDELMGGGLAQALRDALAEVARLQGRLDSAARDLGRVTQDCVNGHKRMERRAVEAERQLELLAEPLGTQQAEYGVSTTGL